MARARKRLRAVIVAARFNEPITRALVRGARRRLRQAGFSDAAIGEVWVPGAFELPLAASLAAVRKPEAIVAVGCLIKGRTPQYEAIGQAVANGLMQVSVLHQVPVGFGVIIAESVAQATARAGGAMGNRGEEAAAAALDMRALRRRWRVE